MQYLPWMSASAASTGLEHEDQRVQPRDNFPNRVADEICRTCEGRGSWIDIVELVRVRLWGEPSSAIIKKIWASMTYVQIIQLMFIVAPD
jgi:hypothetical protein